MPDTEISHYGISNDSVKEDGFSYTQQESTLASYHILDNNYKVDYQLKNKWLRYIRVFASCHGFRVKYFDDYKSIDYEHPIIDRIEPDIPSTFDLQYRRMSSFQAHFEFSLQLGSGIDSSLSNKTFGLYLNAASEAKVYVDETLMLSVLDPSKVIYAVNCDPSKTLQDTNPIFGTG